MNRAIRSLSRPKASGSYDGVGTSPRRTSRGWSRRVVRRGSRAIGHTDLSRLVAGPLDDVALVAPVVGEQVVENVVHGDRAQQVVVLVDHRGGDHVVGRQVVGDRG